MNARNEFRRLRCRWITLLVGVCVAAFNFGEAAERKGKDGKVGGDVSGWVFLEVTIEDGANHLIVSDGLGPYIDGEDRTQMRVGRNFNIGMNFNTHKSKPYIRTLSFPQGLSDYLAPPEGSCGTGQVIAPDPSHSPPNLSGPAPDVSITIHGQDHDDTPLYCERQVPAWLKVRDKDETTWTLEFPHPSDNCPQSYVAVTRMPNDPAGAPGISEWQFTTVGTGYLFREGDKPSDEREYWGEVTPPENGVIISGTLKSLTEEEPPAEPCIESGVPCDLYNDGVCQPPEGAGAGLTESSFLRGDSNADGAVDLADPIHTLNYLFLGGAAPSCADAADSDDNGRVEVTDAVFTLGWLFLGEGVMPSSGPEVCGPDTTEDVLPDCEYDPLNC